MVEKRNVIVTEFLRDLFNLGMCLYAHGMMI